MKHQETDDREDIGGQRLPTRPDHRSARVVLLDQTNRVLLLKTHRRSDTPAAEQAWLTPGGTVQEGETPAQVAARQLHKEIGLAPEPGELGQPVAHTFGYADLPRASGWFRDDFFHYRTTEQQARAVNQQPAGLAHATGHRWWTLDELAAATETVIPSGLCGLAAVLAGGHRPTESVRLPWPH